MPLVLPIVVLLGISLVDAIRRPTIRRLALRNLTRRRSEAALVILGSLLGTAIITAAFIVGDTLGASVRDQARTELGPTDEVVRVLGLNASGAVFKDLKDNPVAHTDGLLQITHAGISVSTVGSDPRAEPFAGITEANFDDVRAFGGDGGATGFADAGATPTGTQAVITRGLAKKLKAKPNDTIHVYGFGSSIDLTVRQVLPLKGMGGYGNPSLYAAPGTIATLLQKAGGGLPAGEPPSSLVLVSNDGGVFSGAKHSDEVAAALNQRFASQRDVQVVTAKQDLLDDADATSKQFKTIFGGIGAFSVIAGILLLVNIFVMLADERKSELGMLRAIGLKRNQLVRSFGMEGAIYSMVAAFFGVIAGVGVGRLVAVIASKIFNRGGFRGELTLHFALKPSSLVLGFVIGAAISLVTVWGTSIRLGRLNVIRAIRDLGEAPPNRTARVRSYVLAIVGIILGFALFASGVQNKQWFGVLAGVPIAAVSSITLLRGFLPKRLAVGLGAGASVVWGIFVFSLFPDALSNTDFAAFVVQGVILVGCATAIVATNDDVAIWVVSKLGVSKRTLAARLGFAYPLARVFRTSMLLGMYAIVVFTLTFLSVFSHLFSAQAPRFASQTSAGYDVLVDSNYSNPVPRAALLAQPDVDAVATMATAFPEWTTKTVIDRTRWSVTGFDEGLLARGVPSLTDRLPRYKSDRSAWEAVLRDPSLIVLSDFFLEQGGPPSGTLKVGDKVRIYDPLTCPTGAKSCKATGGERVLTIAGKAESDFTFSGPFVGKPFLTSFMKDITPSRHYLAVKPGADPKLTADRITGKLITYGVDAMTFQERISERLNAQRGFLTLMQGYLGLGLIIGIAGLGVVMVRAVRERRRQIGMLRAMGFSSRLVRQVFLVESAFLAIQGIVLGTILALVTSYNLLTHSSTFGGQSLHFTIPWINIAVVSTIAFVGSLLASGYPAGQASRIKPAVALRIAD